MPRLDGLRVTPVDSDAGLLALAAEWREMESSAGNENLTASYDWLIAWWQAFGRRDDVDFGFDKRLLILRVESANGLAGIAPFVRVKRRRRFEAIECVEFLGQQWAGTSLDMLARPEMRERAAAEALRWVGENVSFHILNLRYLPASSPFLSLLPSFSHPYTACPSLRPEAFTGFEDYRDRTYSKSLKQNLRTAQNKLRQDGRALEFSFAPLGPEAMNEVARLSKSKLEDGKHSLYLDERKSGFISRLAGLGSQVLFVSLDGVKVAYRLNVEYRGAKFCLDASFDRTFPKYELGGFSVQENIRDSFERGLSLHCEGTGIDFYKAKFLKDALMIKTVVAKGNRWTSWAYARRETASARDTGREFQARWDKLYA
ncbi:MAG: GNAT family N-acetyltransferase [Fibrobacteres bacterium]|nr:GNAT family N-acetyltransferase [Fibrobacterota bacterium]